MTIRILQRIWDALAFNLFFGRSKIKYLRFKGATIGKNCCLICDMKNFGTEPYLIYIGDKVTITNGVTFLTHDGSTWLFRDSDPDMNQYGNVFGTIKIGDNCFLGSNTILLPGTFIGSDSIVGAGSVVKGQFMAGSVIAGVPAKILRSTEEHRQHIRQTMAPLRATNRPELKEELLTYFASSKSKSDNSEKLEN